MENNIYLFLRKWFFSSLFFLILSSPVLSASTPDLSDVIKGSEILSKNIDIIWVLLCSVLVFFMQAGFMCLETGMARAKNSINVAVKNMVDFLIAVGAFWILGFGLMFGDSYLGIIGTTNFFADIGHSSWFATFFVFQVVFVGTAATIDSGAVAERTKFVTYIIISLFTTLIIYPVFGHWAWGSFFNGESPGWLENLGFIDFAGSSVVHSVGGWVVLAGVIAVGPRIGKFDINGKPRKLQPHNLILVYLGTFILFVGWFGFNAGSTLQLTPLIAVIALNTVVAASFGGLTCGILSWLLSSSKIPEADMIANGVIGGLVGITAGCASVSPTGAVAIGIGGGITVYLGIYLMENVLKLDDVVGAVAVHGFTGAWGTLAVGLFITDANWD
ncbi:MAG: ammonium transporter [Ignavibacteria bacterium]|jgi:Amt family ammonium transporter